MPEVPSSAERTAQRKRFHELEPPTKTAVGYTTFKITPPELYFVRIETKSMGTFVKSQRLRNLAIRDFVKIHLTDFTDSFAIHFSAATEEIEGRPMPIDHLIIHSPPGRDNVVETVEDVRERGATKSLNLTKQVRRQDGSLSSEPVNCCLPYPPSLIGEDSGGTYWKKLSILVHEYAIEGPRNRPHRHFRERLNLAQLTSPTQTESECNTSISSRQSISSLAPSQISINEARDVGIYFRDRIKIDGEKCKLHFELDLVPGVGSSTKLSNVLIQLFGRDVLGSGNTRHLSIIKRLLIGLSVRRDYQTPNCTEREARQAQATGADHEHGNINRISPRLINTLPIAKNRPTPITTGQTTDITGWCIINDVKSVGDVGTFKRDRVKYSVVKYFEEQVLAGEKLKFPTLPLANIGRNDWVPLEKLIVNFPQVLGASGLMTNELQEVRDGLQVEAAREWMEQHYENIISDIHGGSRVNSKRRPFINVGSTFHYTFFAEETDSMNGGREIIERENTVTTLDTSMASTFRTHEEPFKLSIKLRIGLLYVAPSVISQGGSDSFLSDIRTRIQRSQQKVVALEPNVEPLIGVINDIKPILLPDLKGRACLRAFYEENPNTLLGIIDTRGRSKSEIQNINAEIRKFGNRKVGAVTHCITRQHLEVLLDNNKTNVDYFPHFLLQKFNAMHGGTNLANTPLGSFRGNNKIMVVGAHISHPGSGAAQHCPSVAAIVASTDQKAVHYPGSIRLQPTIASVEKKKKHPLSKARTKHITQSKIVGLGDMMEERFTAWKQDNNNTENAPEVLFYRDSISFLERETIDEEMAAIRLAMRKVFSKRQALTYVVLNKTTNNPYRNEAEFQRCLDRKKISHFPSEDQTRPAPRAKYGYYVMRAEGERAYDESDLDRLNELTRELNTRSQLAGKTNNNLAIVPPLHYAQKLALRTFDYFRFGITNQYDTVSSVVRRVWHPDSEAHKNDEEMKMVMEHYLLGVWEADQVPYPRPWEQKNPWLESLNKTMFYL